MSETAQTLIKASLRVIGVIGTGETPTAEELTDGLQALQFMLRHWADKNIRIYYTVESSISLTGAESYTIGTGGDINTSRPAGIRRVFSKDEDGYEDEMTFRYNGGYPLGTIYVDKNIIGTMYVESFKQFTEPTVITSTISFPPGYDEAIKWNLAIRLAPEYGKEISSVVASLALSSLNDLESRNFNDQLRPVKVEVIKIVKPFDITYG